MEWEEAPERLAGIQCPIGRATLGSLLPCVRRLCVPRAGSAWEVAMAAHGMSGLRELGLGMARGGELTRIARLRRRAEAAASTPLPPAPSVRRVTVDLSGGADVDMLRNLFNDSRRGDMVAHATITGQGVLAIQAIQQADLSWHDARLLFPGCTSVAFLGPPLPELVRCFFMPGVTRLRFGAIPLVDAHRHGDIYASLLATSFRGCGALRLGATAPGCGGPTGATPAAGMDGREYLLATAHWLAGLAGRGRAVTIEADPALAEFMRLSDAAGDSPDFVHPETGIAYYVLGRAPGGAHGAGYPLVALTRGARCCASAPGSAVVCHGGAAAAAGGPPTGRRWGGSALYRVACRSCCELLDSPEKLHSFQGGDALPPSAREGCWALD